MQSDQYVLLKKVQNGIISFEYGVIDSRAVGNGIYPYTAITTSDSDYINAQLAHAKALKKIAFNQFLLENLSNKCTLKFIGCPQYLSSSGIFTIENIKIDEIWNVLSDKKTVGSAFMYDIINTPYALKNIPIKIAESLANQLGNFRTALGTYKRQYLGYPTDGNERIMDGLIDKCSTLEELNNLSFEKYVNIYESTFDITCPVLQETWVDEIQFIPNKFSFIKAQPADESSISL